MSLSCITKHCSDRTVLAVSGTWSLVDRIISHFTNTSNQPCIIWRRCQQSNSPIQSYLMCCGTFFHRASSVKWKKMCIITKSMTDIPATLLQITKLHHILRFPGIYAGTQGRCIGGGFPNAVKCLITWSSSCLIFLKTCFFAYLRLSQQGTVLLSTNKQLLLSFVAHLRRCRETVEFKGPA